MTRQTDVLGVEVVDQPGNLNSLLKTLLETNIDIDYIYLSFNRESGWRVMNRQPEAPALLYPDRKRPCGQCRTLRCRC